MCCVYCDTDMCFCCGVFFFQAEDGIRDLVRSRGLGDVYKRQGLVGMKLQFESEVTRKFIQSSAILHYVEFSRTF